MSSFCHHGYLTDSLPTSRVKKPRDLGMCVPFFWRVNGGKYVNIKLRDIFTWNGYVYNQTNTTDDLFLAQIED